MKVLYVFLNLTTAKLTLKNEFEAFQWSLQSLNLIIKSKRQKPLFENLGEL